MYYHFYNRDNAVDQFGIPVLRTTYVTTDVTTTSVTYGICYKVWRRLPCQGLFILHVTSTPASIATATDTVLLNGSGAQMTNNEITTGNRYLIYYNKCQGIFQVINHIVTTTAPAA